VQKQIKALTIKTFETYYESETGIAEAENENMDDADGDVLASAAAIQMPHRKYKRIFRHNWLHPNQTH
jgi:hypothetical protein